MLVIDPSGACIVGATARVIAGQALGQTATLEQPCSVWSYGDDGAVLKGLTPFVEVTVLISAKGYVTREITVVPPLYRHEVELVPEGR